jgi:thiamine transporter ThiT
MWHICHMKNFKQQVIAFLIRKGFKPHPSNILHIKAGYYIGLGAGIVSFLILGNLISIPWAVFVAAIVALVSACVAGYAKEKMDGAKFDRLDLYATAFGGYLAASTMAVVFLLINLILSI